MMTSCGNRIPAAFRELAGRVPQLVLRIGFPEVPRKAVELPGSARERIGSAQGEPGMGPRLVFDAEESVLDAGNHDVFCNYVYVNKKRFVIICV